MQSETLRIKGQKTTLIHMDSGRWSTNYGTSDTREGAIRMAAAGIEAENSRFDYQAKEQASRRMEREAKTVPCDVCGVRVSNLATHQKSARHRNAESYRQYRSQSRY